MSDKISQEAIVCLPGRTYGFRAPVPMEGDANQITVLMRLD